MNRPTVPFRAAVSRLTIVLLCLLPALLAQAQSLPSKTGLKTEAPAGRSATEAIAKELLAKPAPPPPVPVDPNAPPPAERPTSFYDAEKPPPDNAPIEDLIDYWTTINSQRIADPPKPTEAVRERLLEAAETDSKLLPDLLSFIPDSKDAADRVIKLYEGAQGQEDANTGWLTTVHGWLLYNSTLELGELTALASKVKDRDGAIVNDDALIGLAKVDREHAIPLLQTYAQGAQPRTAVLALALLYKYAVTDQDAAEADYRARLQSIAADTTARAKSRDTAIDALLATEWSGRDDWYLSLFADNTLVNPTDSGTNFTPLTSRVYADPEKWLPLLEKLIDSKDQATRRNAVNCLVKYTNDHPRRELLLPLVPWLMDPNRQDLNSSLQTGFIQQMGAVDIPESVPGLIWIVGNDTENRRWAAQALARYKDPRAIPALNRAVSEEVVEWMRDIFLGPLIGAGGIPEADQLKDVETYAAKLTTKEGRDEVDSYQFTYGGPPPLPLVVGKFLAQQTEVSDTLAVGVLNQAEAVKKRDPALAAALLEVSRNWQIKPVDLDLVRRIGEETANAEMIANTLDRRERLRQHGAMALRSISGVGGLASGVAAVLLGDDAQAQNLLAGKDDTAKLGLLTCARLTQTPLPVPAVRDLLGNQNKLLALAAERYLLAEDSSEARQALWAHRPHQAFVAGWRESVPQYTGLDLSAIDKAEDSLRREVLRATDPPLAVYAVINNYELPGQVVRIYRDRAVYDRYENQSRYRERVIDGDELSRFRADLESSNVTAQGPQFGLCGEGCMIRELLVLGREGGTRVFISGYRNTGDLEKVFAKFDALDAGTKTHYRLEDNISGAEVLLADPALTVHNVWQQGDDLRVQVEREQTDEEKATQAAEYQDLQENSDAYDAQALEALQRRQNLRDRERTTWFRFQDGSVGGPAERPGAIIDFNEPSLAIDEESFTDDENNRLGSATAGNFFVLAADAHPGGLWKKQGAAPAVPIGQPNVYHDPVVTPDGKWVVAIKKYPESETPDLFVRIDLTTGKEFPIKLAPADTLEVLGYVAAQRGVVVQRSRGSGEDAVGPATPEYHLIDPATGSLRPITGEFRPLLQISDRLLQPTSHANECWAAIPDEEKNETQVGRYDQNDLSFHPVMTVPHLQFDSMAMWVDDANGKVYIVYDGQLIRIPLVQPAPVAAGR